MSCRSALWILTAEPRVYCSAATRAMLLKLQRYSSRINFHQKRLEKEEITYKHQNRRLVRHPEARAVTRPADMPFRNPFPSKHRPRSNWSLATAYASPSSMPITAPELSCFVSIPIFRPAAVCS